MTLLKSSQAVSSSNCLRAGTPTINFHGDEQEKAEEKKRNVTNKREN